MIITFKLFGVTFYSWGFNIKLKSLSLRDEINYIA